MKFESPKMTWDRYSKKLTETGGIVEELITGRDFRSPSAQLRVTPLGEVEALSTHDQMLGGPSGQAYLGCKFPASPEYGPAIMREALKVGRRLAKEGVIGRFALDFVAVLNDQDQWEVYAIEINLRKGGTTHPFLTLQFLTDGAYNAETGVFTTPRGEPKSFVASDHVHSPAYRSFTHNDLFDIVGAARPALRSVAPERHRLSHGERRRRTRSTRADRRRQHARRSRSALQQDGRGAGRRGQRSRSVTSHGRIDPWLRLSERTSPVFARSGFCGGWDRPASRPPLS